MEEGEVWLLLDFCNRGCLGVRPPRPYTLPCARRAQAACSPVSVSEQQRDDVIRAGQRMRFMSCCRPVTGRAEPRAHHGQDACRKGWLRASPTGLVAPAAVLAVAADIAAAMVALHGAGIVHGDLSGGALPRRDDMGFVVWAPCQQPCLPSACLLPEH